MVYSPVSSPDRGTRPTFMAQFTVQGRLKLLSHGDKLSLALDFKDPFRCKHGGSRFKVNPLQIHKNKLRLYGIGKVCSTKSSSSSAEECLDDGDDGDDDGNHYEDDGYSETDDLACFRGLVLDISYRPINVVCWRRAICLEFMEKVWLTLKLMVLLKKFEKSVKGLFGCTCSCPLPDLTLPNLLADVLEYYDQTVSSPSGSFYIPAVLRVPNLLQVVKRRRIKHLLSRKNIFYRDSFACQYCSSYDNLTIDHVLPISRGGDWKWENLVTACAKCNSKKGKKTLEEANMRLIKVPKAPKDFDILAIPLTTAAIKMMRMRSGMPDEWRQYLSRPSSES